MRGDGSIMKPNILFFITDDQRFDTLGCMGCKEIKTPNIDKLAEDSVVFDQAHIMGGTCGAVCMPSRAMVQTGRSLFHLAGEGKANGSYIPEEHVTIPEYLRSKGYFTYHIGKWHQDIKSFNRSYNNGSRITGIRPTYATGYQFTATLLNYDETGKYEIENAYNLMPDMSVRKICKTNAAMHSTDIFCRTAVDFINDYDSDKPFYLYVATHAPHDPRESPNEFEEMYNTENVSCPENFMEQHPFDNGDLIVRDELLEAFPRRKHAIRRHISDYYAMISHIDARFGDVIDSLKKKGIYDNTIIIYAGDNGIAIGQHGLMGKQNIYEHSIRVPLIIKMPNSSAKATSDAYCYLMDIFPTLCDICGFDIPSSVEGESLLPVINGEKKETRDHLFGAYRNYQRSYKKDGYKLIEYYVNGERHTQLFNLNNDKIEMNNLYGKPEYSEMVEQMRTALHNEQEKLDDPLVCKSEEELKSDIW